MRKHLLLVTTIILMLPGCSTVQDLVVKTYEVWMDPSIAVGDPAETPSQVTYTFLADNDVNPNPFAEIEKNFEEGADISKEIETTDEPAFEVRVARPMSSVPELSPEHDLNDETLFYWEELEQVENSRLEELARQRRLVQERMREQYKEDNPKPAEVAEGHATPIAIKVVQLKDDALMLGADYNAIHEDIEGALKNTYIAHEDFEIIPGQYKQLPLAPLEEGVYFLGFIAAYTQYEAAEWKKTLRVEPNGRVYSILIQAKKDKLNIQVQE